LFLNSRKKLGIFFVGGFSLLAGLILIVTATVGAKPARAQSSPAEPSTPMSQITLASLGAGIVVVDRTNSSSTYTLKSGYIYKFEVWGAQGGNGGGDNGGTGGRGSYAIGWYDMRTNTAQSVTWFAGRQGSVLTAGISNLTSTPTQYNGINGGTVGNFGGGGGGASGIRLGTTELVIAGGGGGGGGSGMWEGTHGGGTLAGGTNGNEGESRDGEAGMGGCDGGAGGAGNYGNGGGGTTSAAGNSFHSFGGSGGGGGGGALRGISGGGGGCSDMGGYQWIEYRYGAGGGGANGTSRVTGVVSISGNAATSINLQRAGHGRVVITEYELITYTIALPPQSGTGWILVN